VTRFSGPFFAAVGGTTGIKPETAINSTGRGFSNYFPRTSYQDKDVTAYIKTRTALTMDSTSAGSVPSHLTNHL